MKWASALSELPRTADALAEVCGALEQQLAGDAPDLLIAFASPEHAAAFATLAERVRAAFPRGRLLGCSARGVIGAGHEVEERAALSLTAAVLPGVHLTPFALDELPDGDEPARWRERVGAGGGADPHLLLLVDPMSCDAEDLIAGLDRALPAARKVGGLARAPRRWPGATRCGSTAPPSRAAPWAWR
jgi:small ligand-binding sensory domain FIST